MQVQQSGTPITLAASGAISTIPGSMIGYYVNSTTAGTISIRDGGASGPVVSGTMSPAVGWHTFPCAISSPLGAYATLGLPINVTFFFAAGG